MSNKLIVIFDVLMGLAVLTAGTVLLMIGGVLIGLVLGAGTLVSRMRGKAPKQKPAAAAAAAAAAADKNEHPNRDSKSPA